MMRKLIEVAYVVEDLDQAIDRWMNELKVGPWFRGVFEVPGVKYRDSVFDLRVDVGFAMSNGIMIELMEQLDDTPSLFTELGQGYNHMMFSVENRDAEVSRFLSRGLGLCTAGPIWMVDDLAQTGGFVEIGNYEGFIGRMYDGLKKANEAWDGKPVPTGDLFALVG